MVQGDPGRLRQVLTNLVSNALKFIVEGEVVIRANLQEISGELRRNCEVIDTGIGIPASKQAQLFDSFTQVDTQTTRKYGGTGLGLSIAKKLCELMNGHIEVISEEGVCTCFTFNIALGTSPQSQLLAPKTPFSAAKILVIDDNSMNRAVVQSQLSHWGADVSEAESGRHALEILADARSRDQFEIAILDMAMPDMNGAELGRIIRDNPDYNDLKLVMMTSVSIQGDAKYFADIGFSTYFLSQQQ